MIHLEAWYREAAEQEVYRAIRGLSPHSYGEVEGIVQQILRLGEPKEMLDLLSEKVYGIYSGIAVGGKEEAISTLGFDPFNPPENPEVLRSPEFERAREQIQNTVDLLDLWKPALRSVQTVVREYLERKLEEARRPEDWEESRILERNVEDLTQDSNLQESILTTALRRLYEMFWGGA